MRWITSPQLVGHERRVCSERVAFAATRIETDDASRPRLASASCAAMTASATAYRSSWHLGDISSRRALSLRTIGLVGASLPASATVRTAKRYSALTGAVSLGRTKPAAVSATEAALRSDVAPPRDVYQATNATMIIRSVRRASGPSGRAAILIRAREIRVAVSQSPRSHRGGPYTASTERTIR